MSSPASAPDDSLDPFERFNRAAGAGQVRSPYPLYAELRRLGPILPLAEVERVRAGAPKAQTQPLSGALVAVRFDAVQQVLRDAEHFSSGLYAAAIGLDLGALVVIRAPQLRALGRAADQLARSGGVRLIVVDLGAALDPWGQPLSQAHASTTRVSQTRATSNHPDAAIGMPLQSRLLGLAQKHQIALVFLSHKSPDDASLSSLVSLRGHVQRRFVTGNESGDEPGDKQKRFAYEVTAIKDKRRAPGWSHVEVVDGPPGLT